MKYTLNYIILIAFLGHFSACNIKQQIVGTWSAESKNNSPKAVYNFRPNGTLQLKTSQLTDIYNWKFSKKNKSIVISKKNDPSPTVFFVNHLDLFFLGLSNTNEGLLLSRKFKVKSLSHQAARKRLKGEWTLVEFEDSTLVVWEKSLKMTFWDNGIYEEATQENIQLGRWLLSDDNHTLTLSNDHYTQTVQLHFLQQQKLELMDEYGSYLMTKTAHLPQATSMHKVAKKMVGTWALKKVGERIVEGSNYSLFLHEDGSFKIFEQEQVSKMGKWNVSEDGLFLILNHSQGQDSYPIEGITRKKLRLLDDFQSITFRRIKYF